MWRSSTYNLLHLLGGRLQWNPLTFSYTNFVIYKMFDNFLLVLFKYPYTFNSLQLVIMFTPSWKRYPHERCAFTVYSLSRCNRSECPNLVLQFQVLEGVHLRNHLYETKMNPSLYRRRINVSIPSSVVRERSWPRV